MSPLVAAAAAVAQVVRYDIPPGPLAATLERYARLSGRQLIYRSDEIQAAQSRGVSGEMSPEAALDVILSGSGFVQRRDSSGAIAIVKVGRVGAADNAPQPDLASSSPATGDNPDNVIVVTGTNIRGIAPASSPTRVFTREDIQRSGAATAQEFISKLPENFGGGSNEGVPGGLPNDNSAGANSGGFGSYGSSVNLRGLGSGSTLVLLNGHRVAPASAFGDFADISMIPASAIKQVETLTDGASSVYGSDAVAGVVNFILRDDFEGLETSVRYGVGTEGGAPDQVRASVTGGKQWGSGNALVTYEYFNQTALNVEDRGFANKAFAPSYLLPRQRRHSLFGAISQELTGALSFKADGLYSRRKASQLRYDYIGRERQYRYDATSDSLGLSGSGSWQMTKDWFLDFAGVYGRARNRNITSGTFASDRKTFADVWNFDAKITGPLFTLPAGQVRIALGAQFRKEGLKSTNLTQGLIDRSASRKVRSLYGEAYVPLVAPRNAVPGVHRLELNLSGRYSHYSDFDSTTDPKVGLLYSPIDGVKFRGSLGTSFKAPALGYVGSRDLGASVLRTSFLFPIFGLTPADPSLADVIQLTLGGIDKNLKPETSRSMTAGLDFSKSWARHTLSASATWFDINYKNRLGNVPIPGNVIHFDAINIAFRDPSAFPAGSYIFQPTRAEIDEVLESLDTPLGNPFGLNPYDTYFISKLLLLTNTSRTVARGLDFRMSYSFDLGGDTILAGLDGTYLRDFKLKATATTPSVQRISTLFSPVDLKMRGRLGYAGKQLSAMMFVNYVNGYKANSTANAVPIRSWTTVDVTAAFEIKDAPASPLFRNTTVRVSVTNLFDRDPPKIPYFSDLRVDGYDPTNASPLGRFVSLELAKRF